MAANKYTVFIPTKGADNVMPMVRYLRGMGLVQGIDFNFKYQAAIWDWTEGVTQESGVTFELTEGKWATFLRMKFNGKD